jgi:hypothetical protein
VRATTGFVDVSGLVGGIDESVQKIQLPFEHFDVSDRRFILRVRAGFLIVKPELNIIEEFKFMDRRPNFWTHMCLSVFLLLIVVVDGFALKVNASGLKESICALVVLSALHSSPTLAPFINGARAALPAISFSHSAMSIVGSIS